MRKAALIDIGKLHRRSARNFLSTAARSGPYSVFCRNNTCMLGVICRDLASDKPTRSARLIASASDVLAWAIVTVEVRA